MEEAGAVQRMDPADYANLKRRQRDFANIIDRMADIRTNAINSQIEELEAIGEEEQADELRDQLRHVRRDAIQSTDRKDALKTLSELKLDRETKAGNRYYKTKEENDRARDALKVLGRRDGIPDWVPVGMSGKAKAGKLRQSRIPARFRAMDTRRSKG